jgi:hypothetical protein
MQNSLVYKIITIYVADKQKKLSVTKHPPDTAANHAKFVDFAKTCQPTNMLMRILVRLRLCQYVAAGRAAPGQATQTMAVPGRRRRIENVKNLH